MGLDGFSRQWKDFPDYILGITRQIWEGRAIAAIHDYYASDIVVRSPGCVVIGNDAVIAATMATLAEFPDRMLYGEDVIWSKTSDAHYLSSHRIVSTATHAHDGVYGKATGKTLTYRIIADCAARSNVIDDEWLIRDQGAIIRQLGLDPEDYARDLIEREGGAEACVKPFTPDGDAPGPYTGTGNDNEWGARFADIMRRIMNGEMNVIAELYDRGCQLHYPGGITGHSHGAAERFWMGLRAAFPSADFTIHHCIGRNDRLMAPRAAIRWSLDGVHEGWGAFGRPTGARVHVMGISHAEFGPYGGQDGWGLRREYTLYDETAIWKQIILKTG